jgi:hypothetical protein
MSEYLGPPLRVKLYALVAADSQRDRREYVPDCGAQRPHIRECLRLAGLGHR